MLRSLTLIEPTLMHLLRMAGQPAVWREAEQLGLRHIAAFQAGRSAEIADEFIPYWIGPEAWQAMQPERKSVIIATMTSVAEFWASEFAETTPADVYERLHVSTLLLRGARTRATAYEIVELLRSLLPIVDLVDVEGAGHMVPLTHPAEVNAAVAQHLLRYSGTAS